MSWLKRLTDQLVLRPTTHPISNNALERQVIHSADGELEIWTAHYRANDPTAQALWIKFPGTGGRAESSSVRPANVWQDVDSKVWTVNPFGYGNSSGEATLQRFPEMIELLGEAAQNRYPDRPVVVVGNSLGSISALAYAARFPVAGVLLKNPVPIHQMISRRAKYAFPSLGLSRFIAAQIPDSLDAIRNAKQCQAPGVIVSAQQDRVVPVQFQNQVIAHYGGDSRVIRLPSAAHHDAVPAERFSIYQESLLWMKTEFVSAHRLGVDATANRM
ncbi:MAG: alpha/beta fold hydrolase [Planctomycetota bacterium]